MTSDEARLSVLRTGLEALHLPAPPATQRLLLQYADLLVKWNRHFNLTAVRAPQDMLTQHLLDCLAAIGPLDAHLGSAAARVLDVGSGAGLPGVVLAVMRPHWQVCCVDAVAKKAGFVRQVAVELGLPNLHSEHARIEQLALPPFELITCRAFASLADFVALTRSALAPGGCWVAMKGQHPTAELAALPTNIDVFHVEQLSVPGLVAQRCLVWMRPAADPGEPDAVSPRP